MDGEKMVREKDVLREIGATRVPGYALAPTHGAGSIAGYNRNTGAEHAHAREVARRLRRAERTGA